MELSFHVCNVPCPEEFYMGVNSDYEAYIVEIPDELFPKELLDIMKNQGLVVRNERGEITRKVISKTVTAIAPVRE